MDVTILFTIKKLLLWELIILSRTFSSRSQHVTLASVHLSFRIASLYISLRMATVQRACLISSARRFVRSQARILAIGSFVLCQRLHSPVLPHDSTASLLVSIISLEQLHQLVQGLSLLLRIVLLVIWMERMMIRHDISLSINLSSEARRLFLLTMLSHVEEPSMILPLSSSPMALRLLLVSS